MSGFLAIKNLFLQNKFFQDSGLLFFTNISTSVLNYGLIFLVANLLTENQFSEWVIIGGLITLLISVTNGIKTHYIRRVSSLENKQPGLGFVYRLYILKWVKYLLILTFLSSPLIAWVIQLTVVPNQNYWLVFLVVNQVIFAFAGGLSQQFLLGILAVKEFAISSILANIIRLIATILLILVGVGATALPVGLILNTVITYFLSWYYTQQKLKSNQELATKAQILMDEAKTEGNHANVPNFRLKEEFLGSQWTAISLFLLVTFLTAINFFGDRFLSKSGINALAVIYTFGQILHYGPTAFLMALIPYSARAKGPRLVLQAWGAASLMTLGGILGLVLFGPLVLQLMGKSPYTNFLPLILVFGVFILFYNIIYVATQYLVSKARFKEILSLLGILISYGAAMVVVSHLNLNLFFTSLQEPLLVNFILTTFIFGVIGSVIMVLQTLKVANQD